MHCKNYPFDSLPFSALFQTYLSDFRELDSFYETNPFDIEALQERAADMAFDGLDKGTTDFLLEFNQQFGADDQAIENIDRLSSEDAVALVTGQQLGVFGGPLYTFYKTVAVIQKAHKLEQEIGQPVIPIFWLADEDHDYEEIKATTVLKEEGVKNISLPDDNSDLPVADITFSEPLTEVKTQLKEQLVETDFSEDLWELIDTCFCPGRTFIQAFGSFISRLFSKHGLVLAGSNNKQVKELTKQVLIDSVRYSEEAYEALNDTTEKLKHQYSQQVTLYHSHLFYITESHGRVKINRTESGWTTGHGKQWNEQELISEVDRYPEKFSPDVFLRPLVQDQLLPTLGYVGGPGEMAYYGQMKDFYRVFGMKMPAIIPRLSATFVEPAIVRIFRALPFQISDYQQRIEDLEKSYAQQAEQVDIEALFEDWKEGVEDLQAYHTKAVKGIDETLEGTSEKALAHYFNELDKLKNKTYRAVKKNEEVQIKRIQRIQRNIFPNRNLQERTISGIYYMNKFGVDIWDRLINTLSKDTSLTKHKLIYL